MRGVQENCGVQKVGPWLSYKVLRLNGAHGSIFDFAILFTRMGLHSNASIKEPFHYYKAQTLETTMGHVFSCITSNLFSLASCTP